MNYYETKDRMTVLKKMADDMNVGDKITYKLFYNNKLVKKDTWEKIVNSDQTPNMYTPAIFSNGKMTKFQGIMLDFIAHEHLSAENDVYRLEIDLETK